MPREFKDLIVDEEDYKARYDLVDRDGKRVLSGIKLDLQSEVLQQGDAFGAAAVNLLLGLDENGIPILKLDGGEGEKSGNIKHYRQGGGGEVPEVLPYGEFFVAEGADVFAGNNNNEPVGLAKKSETMPKSGGAFSGTATALNQNLAGSHIRNIDFQNSAGTSVASNRLVTRRL